MTNEELLDKIKAEIEQRIHEISHPLKDGYEIQSIGKIEGLSELLDFLSTLESEKPIPKDLEEVADGYENKHTYQRYDGAGLTPEYDATLAEAVIFGAKWQYQKDRYEFAKLKAKEWSDGYDEGIAKGKEQMMKEVSDVGWQYEYDYADDWRKPVEMGQL